MPQTTALKEALAARVAQLATQASLHSADPGADGATAEVVRKALTWTTGAVDGIVDATADLAVPAGVKVTHGVIRDAAGVALDSGLLSQSYTGPGTYTLTVRYTQP